MCVLPARRLVSSPLDAGLAASGKLEHARPLSPDLPVFAGRRLLRGRYKRTASTVLPAGRDGRAVQRRAELAEIRREGAHRSPDSRHAERTGRQGAAVQSHPLLLPAKRHTAALSVMERRKDEAKPRQPESELSLRRVQPARTSLCQRSVAVRHRALHLPAYRGSSRQGLPDCPPDVAAAEGTVPASG